MGLTFHTTILPDHVRIELIGSYAFTDLMKNVELFKAAAISAGRDHIFIDARSVEGKMTESEKFFVGSHIAEVFGSKFKAVVLMAEGNVTKLGEMAAVNRGARLLVTESEEEANQWLGPRSAGTSG